jgi:hydrogenase maturation protease
MSTLVLGLGNTILRDDGIAVRVVRELEPVLSSSGISVKSSSLSGLALLDEILGYDRVVVVDAVQSENHRIGEIFQIDFRELEALPRGGSPHYVGLPSLMYYCRQYGLDAPAEIQVLGIEVEDPYSFDEKLNDELENAIPSLAEKVKTFVLSR